jgi:tetratricopeptide (TPR) repeat protein
LDSNYLKPYVRRAESYKQIDKLEDALQDYQKILELDPNNQQARKEVYVRFLVYHSIDILRIFF